MLLKPKEQIPLIIPALEWALGLAQWILLPGAVVFAELSFLSNYIFPKNQARPEWPLTAFLLSLFALHLLLVRVPAIRVLVENAAAQIKRRAVLACPWVSAGPQVERRVACWLIPDAYKQPLFRYDAQKNIVESVVRRLATEDDKSIHYIYIEGDSGQGKTRTIFLLIHALLKHPTLLSLVNRTFLYDMANGKEVQTLACRRLDSIYHDSALVFLDNFHRVEPEVLRTVTQKLLDTAARNSERLIVLLGQPSHAWRIRPTAEIRLLSTARKNSAFFTLGGVSRSLLLDELLGRPEAELWRSAFGPAATGSASVPQLFFAQAVANKTGRQGRLIRELLELIEGIPSDSRRRQDQLLVRVVALITSLSLYKGSFRIKDFWRACWATTSQRPWPRRLIMSSKMRHLLWLLSRVGFAQRQATPRAHLAFHEAMAVYCKDRLEKNDVFWESFGDAIRWRLTTAEGKDPVLRWLLSCEIQLIGNMQAMFERALLAGTLSTMTRCLDRNWSTLKEHASVGYQYALLLDQAGRFSESRRLLSESTARSPEEFALSDRVQLARIEVEHGEAAYGAIDRIAKGGNPINELAAEYWRIHLDAHRGIFRPEDLITLAGRLPQIVSGDELEQSYFLLHIAARIFFDAHRHTYLVGEHVKERLAHLQELPLENILQRRLPQFRALAILYREAHLLCHEILPNLVFFGGNSVQDAFGEKSSNHADAAKNINSVVTLGREAYARARDEFALYGDRESLYLQADCLNLELIEADPDFESIRLKLIDYEGFIQKAAFTDILSYPSYYFFKWHLLQYFRWLESGDTRYASAAAEENLESGLKYLRRALQLDAASHNAYGLWRIRLFLGLVNGLAQQSGVELMKTLLDQRSEAAKLGYRRDERLVECLLGKRVTPLAVKRMILYFPFVHQ